MLAAICCSHHVKRAGPGRKGTLENVFLLLLLDLGLGSRQIFAVQFSKFGSAGWPMCDESVDSGGFLVDS
jgi:hypothetical protein